MRITVLLLLLSCSPIFAQKLKTKLNTVVYKYEVYPEFAGYENHKFYNIQITDFNNVEYTYTTSVSEASEKDIANLNSFGFPLQYRPENKQLNFKIKLNSSVKKEISHKAYQDPATKAQKFSLIISAVQNYTISIYDAQNNETLIKEFNLDYTPTYLWPGEPSPTVGYGSVESARKAYEANLRDQKGFKKSIDSKLIHATLVGQISNEIHKVIHTHTEKLFLFLKEIKTKDPKFELLDSASIYIEKGIDEIKLNQKQDILGNHHVANAKKYFTRANEIYLQYSGQEYLNAITEEELKDEYNCAILSNLYYSTFLISDFKKSNEVYDILNKQATSELKAYNDNPSLKSALNRGYAEKALDAINQLRPFQLREELFYKNFLDRFGY